MAPAPSAILDSKVTQGQEAPTPGLNIPTLISQPGPRPGLPYTTHLSLFLSSGEDKALIRAGMALTELLQLPAQPCTLWPCLGLLPFTRHRFPKTLHSSLCSSSDSRMTLGNFPTFCNFLICKVGMIISALPTSANKQLLDLLQAQTSTTSLTVLH